jgi:hypothetical protein
MNISLEDKEVSQGSQVVRVFDTCADGVGEPTEEIGERGGERVATDETTIVTKSLLDAVVVEDSEGDGGLADSAGADESDGSEAFCKTNDLLDPFVASEEDSWWRWWGFSVYTKCGYQCQIHRWSRSLT